MRRLPPDTQSPRWPAIYMLGNIDAAGVEAEFEAGVRRISSPRTISHQRQMLAELHLYCGQPELAASHIRHMSETLLADLEWMDRCPLHDPLRDRADFAHAHHLVSSRVEAIWRI